MAEATNNSSEKFRLEDKSVNRVLMEIVGPVLIMLMVGALVYFLIEVFYRGEHHARLRWVLGLFTFASVLVSRISVEEGYERASLFGFLLGAATLFVTVTLVDFEYGALAILEPVVVILFIAVVMWSTNRLTWDCTVIDDSRDVSSIGLTEFVKRKIRKHRNQNSAKSDASSSANASKSVPQTDPETDSGAEQNSPASERISNPASKLLFFLFANSKTKNTPGLWVFYFSLAAFPIFGFGQWFAQPSNSWGYRWIFLLFAVYLAAGLGLLMLTSLLGLERYLKKRGATLPSSISRSWLMVGTGFALAIMFVMLFLPSPNISMGLENALGVLTTNNKNTSDWAVGNDGQEEGENPRGEKKAEKQGEGQPKPGNQGDGQGKQGGDSKSKQSGNDSSGKQNSNQNNSKQNQNSDQKQNSSQNSKSDGQQNDKNNKRQNDSQNSKSDDKNSTSSNNNDQSKQDRQKPNDASKQDNANKQDSSNRDSDRTNRGQQPNRPPDQSQHDREKNRGQRNQNQNERDRARQNQANQDRAKQNRGNQRQAKNGQRRQQPQQAPQQNPASPSGLGKFLSSAVRFLVYVIGFIVLLVVIWMFRDELAKLWNDLFGSKSKTEKKREKKKNKSESSRPLPKFSQFQEPFNSGLAAKWTASQTIEYTFTALEAWARDHQHPRDQDQTPHEFARQLDRVDAKVSAEARQLADLLGQSLYSEGGVPQSDATKLKQIWQLLIAKAPMPTNPQLAS